jgi:hypothetical protein
MSRVTHAVVTFALISASVASAQWINSWTKPTSGYWEEPHWTFGVPGPDFNHVSFTNGGWKALAIGAATVRDFPASLLLQSLVVRSPSNSFNTLMLNYSGLETPLHVAGGFTLGTNSVFLTLASALRVGDTFWMDGTVNHGAQSDVAASTIHVGVFDCGIYNLTNGVLTANNIDLGDWNSWHSRCALRQEGGSNRVNRLEVWTADYSMLDGDLTAQTINVVGELDGFFYQAGGRVAAAASVTLGHDLINGGVPWGHGRYLLAGGTLRAPLLEVGSERQAGWGVDGSFDQRGGSNVVDVLRVGAFTPLRPDYAASGRYDLRDGLLVTSNTVIGAGLPTFYQTGGSHRIAGALTVQGYHYSSPSVLAYGHYGLHGGTLSVRSINVRLAGIQHSIGTNEVAGDLVLERQPPGSSWYSLDGGKLVTSNTIVFPSMDGRFHLSSGVHEVRGLLDLRGLSDEQGVRYLIEGGDLFVQNIRLGTNGFFRHWNGTLHHTGTLVLEGGTWESAPGNHRLGTLRLDASSVDSTIFFRSPGSTLRFAPSSTQFWHPAARLLIVHWGASTYGWPRIFFGTNASGLTAQQLAQIRFRDPYEPSGDHAAHMRATGEIVPVPNNATVTSRRDGPRSVLQWPSDYGFVLETATNLSGPFAPVLGATPPHTNQLAGPRRFFRLRR